MGIRENVIRLRAKKGWGPYRLAKEAGISQSHLGQIESGEIRSPRGDTTRALAMALGVSTDELLRDSGNAPDVDEPIPVTAVQVPIRAVVVGGDQESALEETGDTYPLLRHLYNDGRAVVRVVRDSMYPTIYPDDLILVDLKAKPRDGEIVVVRINGEATVKRMFRRKRGKGFLFKGDNPLHPPIETTEEDDVEIVAKFVSIVQGERK